MSNTETQSNFNSSGRQKVRVFLEGREVPVISASVVFKLNMPSMANVELTPLSVIKFIKPRTQVHIFVKDSLNFGNDDYYLCFEGEVMGRSMVKQHNGRAFRITAYDYTNYWDDTKTFVMNPQFLAGRMAEAVMYGEPTPGAQAKAEAGTTSPTAANANSLMLDYMLKYKEKDGTPDILKGIKEVASRLGSANEFYRASYERLRVLDRMDFRDSGRLKDFIRGLKVQEFLLSYTGQIGGMASLRQMLMGVLTLFFHDTITVPFPSLLKREGEDGYAIQHYLFLPDMYLIPPPKCNVIFPSQQIGFEFDEDFKSAPTRYGFRNSFPLISGNDSNIITYPIQYYPTPFSDYMMRAKGSSKRSTETELNSMLGPSKLIESQDGRSYADLFYGQEAKGKAVGVNYTPKLREADFVSNEESIKGIFYDSDVLAPAYSSLIRAGTAKIPKADERGRELPVGAASPAKRDSFMREIGKYLFFKKRYGSRRVNATITFNPYLVHGFNCLFLDDSEAGQSFIAKLEGITHNMTNTGFTTVVDLAYGRDFDEIDTVSGGTGDPALPAWFDTNVYGAQDTNNKYFNMETKYLKYIGAISDEEFKYRNERVKNPTVFTEVSKVYQQFLGCNSITNLGAESPKPEIPREAVVTTRGAAQLLVSEYLNKPNQQARDEFVRQYVKRPVVNMQDAFAFIGAEPPQSNTGSIPEEFAKFKAITDTKRTNLPGRFDGTGYSDEQVLSIRRNVIDEYIRQLTEKRGFRG